MGTIITPAPAYQKPSGRIHLGTAQLNLTDATYNLIAFDTVSTGFTDGIEDTTNHRITPGYAGYYSITGLVTLYNLVANRRYRAGLYISGAIGPMINSAWYMGTSIFSIPVFGLAKLTVTDYVDIRVRPDCGANTVDVYNTEMYTFLEVQRVR